MNQTVSTALILGSLLFLGCSEKNITKDENQKEVKENKDIYEVVIQKSIKECRAYSIVLDEAKMEEFIRKSPEKKVAATAKKETKIPQSLCQFFAEEISLEKVEKVKVYTAKVVKSCENTGVILDEKSIHNRVKDLPFSFIKRGLKTNLNYSFDQCKSMQNNYI